MKKNHQKPRINLKNLPPIDPVRSNSSFQRKCNTPSTNTDNIYPEIDQAKGLVEGPKEIDRLNTRETPSSMKLDDTSSGIDGSHGNLIPCQSASENEATGPSTHVGNAKTRLFQLCAANRWKPPVFECCKEEGQSHVRMFTFRVGVEIEAWPKTTIECFGAPHARKKIAADHAAEGALWYLRHEGFVLKN